MAFTVSRYSASGGIPACITNGVLASVVSVDAASYCQPLLSTYPSVPALSRSERATTLCSMLVRKPAGRPGSVPDPAVCIKRRRARSALLPPVLYPRGVRRLANSWCWLSQERSLRTPDASGPDTARPSDRRIQMLVLTVQPSPLHERPSPTKPSGQTQRGPSLSMEQEEADGHSSAASSGHVWAGPDERGTVQTKGRMLLQGMSAQ
eukprot:2528826-Rhodomonas_salina.1